MVMLKEMLALGALALAVAVAPAQADTIDKVRERGKIVVGVKSDYKPWGFIDTDGKIVGLEIDLAQDVADALGVDLEVVAVQNLNRMQFLEQGRIDLLIATMTDRKDRREVVGIVQPNYYSSGTNGLARKSLNLKSWEDLRDKPVCTKQGNFFNKMMEEEFGLKIIAFTGNAEAKQALRDGRCLAWLSDDTSIQGDLQDPAWSEEYEMPFETRDAASWGIGVPKDELDKAFGRFMSGMVSEWHRTGRIVELEKKWNIQPSRWAADMHEKFKEASQYGQVLE
jgi:polar amino acid transport system substrate-binding protein